MKKNMATQKEILLIPLGKVMVDLLNEITVALRKTYQCHVRLGRSEEPPTDCYSDARRQFDAEKLLLMLEPRKHSKLIAIVGIVDSDIFWGEKTFAFGLNKPAEGIAVFSLTRLKQEFYNKTADIEKFMQRAVKEAIYQVSMAADLPVCNHKKCVLSQATALWRLDDKSAKFCEACQGKVDVKILGPKKIKVDENMVNEGPEGQPKMVEDNNPTVMETIEDEAQVSADIVEPDGPLSAEEEALNVEDKSPSEPIDAGSQGL